MSEKQKQIKNSAIYMLPVLIGNALPLVTLPILTRILSPEAYGVLGLAQIYVFFVSGIANFGLTVGYERNFFEYKAKSNGAGLLYSTVLFVTFTFIFCGIITFLFKNQLSHWIIGSTEYADILFWSYCAGGIAGLKIYYLTYFKNSENAKLFALYTIDENLLGVIFSLFFVVYLGVGVIGLLWGPFLASSIIFIALTFRFIRFLPFSLDNNALKESLKLSLPLTPRMFFGVIGNQFDKYLIGLMNTVGGVGIYSIGQKIGYIVFTFMTAIQNVYSPKVYSKMFELGKEGGESIGRYLSPFLYLSVSIALLVSLFAEEVISILTPKSYHDAIEIVSIFSMLYATYFFSKQPQLIYAKKTYISSLLTFLSIGLNILINVPFIMKWGVIGAVWGTFLSGLISGTVMFLVSRHYYKIHYEYGKVALIYGIFFGSVMTIIVLRYFEFPYMMQLLVKMMSLFIYTYLGVALNILSKENYNMIKGMLNVTHK